jgi:pantetheine-phosphate adenylyltransferase
MSKVTVITYEGLTIDLCHKSKDFILRGLRNPADLVKTIAHTNGICQNRNGVLLTAANYTRT